MPPNGLAVLTQRERQAAGTTTDIGNDSRWLLSPVQRHRVLSLGLTAPVRDDHQAFSALNGSPGARGYYDRHRAAGATQHQALRALASRLVGILPGCLRHHQPYNETTAWASQTAPTTLAA